VVVRSEGALERVLGLDAELYERREQWFAREVLLQQKRVLKRLETSARSFFALIEPGSCFAGALFEIALASDRIYMKEGAKIALSQLNGGVLPMGNGLSRLESRFLAKPEQAKALASKLGTYDAQAADRRGARHSGVRRA